MRRAGALAATALLALALALGGCELVDSLTPFGVGTRDYESEGTSANVNGTWVGSTASGGGIAFAIGDNTVLSMILEHVTSECGVMRFEGETLEGPIANGTFTLELNLTSLEQGEIVIRGRFTSADDCTGSYTFQGRPAGVCPTSGTGTFTATKLASP